MSTTVTSEQFIKATPAQVYFALTHATALPNSFVERKASYFLNAAQMLELESHTISHIDQINAAPAAARKS